MLPEPFQSWFVQIVGEAPPVERTATCASCIMCDKGFDPIVKCCTYAPVLPSWRAGQALRAGGEGARRVAGQIRQGRLTPRALHPVAEVEAAYAREHKDFGRTRAVRCPYNTDTGRCSIWAHRNAVCATWFCAHDAGPLGAALWDAAAEVFTFAEQGVAVLCASDDPQEAADRAAQVEWSEIAACGGVELRDKVRALRRAHAAWVAGARNVGPDASA